MPLMMVFFMAARVINRISVLYKNNAKWGFCKVVGCVTFVSEEEEDG